MIESGLFIQEAGKRNFRLFTGVPCSYLKPLINHVIDSDEVRYVGAANEGDAIAIASGTQLGGMRGVAIFQNSGLGNAVNPLSSLNNTFRIPILLIITLRGDPQGSGDEPQHVLMGTITTKMLELLDIQWEYFPTEPENVAKVLDRAVAAMEKTQLPYALVMRKNSVKPHELQSKPKVQPPVLPREHIPWNTVAEATRSEMLRVVVEHGSTEPEILLATTGYCSRELYTFGNRENHLYMVGSMGCVSSFGLGLALSLPQHRIVVLDGDGAALMRMGSLATIGYQRTPNLVHVLFDNEIHESTGGQSTISHSIDFCAIAHACGYPQVEKTTSPGELGTLLNRTQGALSFIHVKTKPGVMEDLPRPSITPAQVAVRLGNFIKSSP
ncbi:MAG: phosphonopyruvate decarboxylase [Magnetococcales bacterium]|nr:phosphonopyruvate decarboxylase [Magnetococcales bacterium]